MLSAVEYSSQENLFSLWRVCKKRKWTFFYFISLSNSYLSRIFSSRNLCAWWHPLKGLPISQTLPQKLYWLTKCETNSKADVCNRWNRLEQLHSILVHWLYKDKWLTAVSLAAVTFSKGAFPSFTVSILYILQYAFCHLTLPQPAHTQHTDCIVHRYDKA